MNQQGFTTLTMMCILLIIAIIIHAMQQSLWLEIKITQKDDIITIINNDNTSRR